MVFILLDVGAIIKAGVYGILALLDYGIYSIAGACFDVIKEIYTYNFFGIGQNSVISNITERIYVVLGILMLFKLVISGVQYIINPDSFDDKEKGLFGILKNAIITILLIAFVPFIFEVALEVQEDIVKAIPNIFFGSGESFTIKDGAGKDVEIKKEISNGSEIAFTVLHSFVNLDKTYGTEQFEVKENGTTRKLDPKDAIHDLDTFKNYVTAGMSDNKPRYDYMILISTAAGVFLVYILLSMSLDIAIRTIKLGIIQMLSPIPISSYMFKKDNFDKFVKISFKVYADLFIRMAIIYVVILVVQILINSPFFEFKEGTSIFVQLLTKVILIFGLLMFAKSAPKFVTDLLGLPDVTGGDIAAMFKRAGGMAGATGSMVTAGVSNFAANKNNNEMTGGQKLKSVIAGATSAGFRGARAALNGKGMKEAFTTGHEGAKQARINRIMDKDQNVKWQDRVRARINEFAGVTTAGNLARERLEALERNEKNVADTKALDVKLLDKYGDSVNVNVGDGANGGKAQMRKIASELRYSIDEKMARNSKYTDSTRDAFQSLTYTANDEQKLRLSNIETKMKEGTMSSDDIAYLRTNFGGTAEIDSIFASGRSQVDSRLIKWQQAMESGGAVSYTDLMSIKNMADGDTSGSMSRVAAMLSSGNETMRAIQKEQFDRIEQNKVVGMDNLTFSGITTDDDYVSQKRKNESDLRKDAMYLNEAFGTKNADELVDKFHQSVTAFGKNITKEVGDTRELVYKDQEARAKESIARREKNKNQNSGK